MIIGTVEIELSLPGVNSLKEKRSRVKSLLARLHNRFNVSASEVDGNDSLRRCMLGAAIVCNNKKYADQTIARIVRVVNSESEMVVIDYHVEIL